MTATIDAPVTEMPAGAPLEARRAGRAAGRAGRRERTYDGPFAWPAAADCDGTALLLVSRGSSDPDGREAALKVAAQVHDAAPDHALGLAFMGYVAPGVPAVFRELVALGARHVALVPLAAHGEAIFARGLQRQAHKLARQHAHVRVSIAPTLDQVPALAGMLLGAALAGATVDGTRAPVESEFEVERAQRLRPPVLQRHAFICTSSWCVERGSADVYGAVREVMREAEADSRIQLTRTSCLRLCGAGPNVVVYPDGTWYSGLDAQGLKRVIEEHLVQGRSVAELACAAPTTADCEARAE